MVCVNICTKVQQHPPCSYYQILATGAQLCMFIQYIHGKIIIQTDRLSQIYNLIITYNLVILQFSVIL